jgi:hypothetical protein
MADDSDKIIPSPPPREPFDVPVVPDPPPAEPFDVPIFPDPPPAQPFDVKVSPSPGPAGTFDVPISPDGPPWQPVDVPTSPSGPPVEPFDVATSPSGPPRLPFDVPTEASPGPSAPFDVPVQPDTPPAGPVDVEVTPSAPPGEPFDVAIEPDGPPVEPIPVGVRLSSPPADPFDVPITLSPPALDIAGEAGVPTIDAIVNAVGRFDSRLGLFLSGLLEIEPVSGQTGFGALDPTVLARWFKDYLNSVGPGGVARFVAEQATLYAMNPVVARVFNPGYFIAMMVPGSMGHVHTTIDTQSGLTADKVAELRDAILQAKVTSDPGRPGGGRPDAFGPENTFLEGADFTVDELVDAAIDGVPHVFTKSEGGNAGAGEIQRFDASRYFDERSGGEMPVSGRVKARALAGGGSYSEGLRQSAAIGGIIRATVGQADVDGVVYSTTQNPSDVVDDDEARVPLCFTDLRKDPIHNGYRSVFFRPMNLTFGKSISPEWNETRAFGRVDPNVAYVGTTKTFTVAWEAHAFAPEDLRIMYNKMVALESMCYPTYGSDGLMRSGPVVRMRIGDAVGTELGGIGGVIKSLSFDFSEALWELRRGMKAPRSFKVNLDFLALHDGPVGILDGQFGVLRLPPDQRPDKDTNLAGSTDSQTQDAETARVLPGMYARFGERRR